MPHITGPLRRVPNSGTLARLAVSDYYLHCGDPLDIHVQGCWLRGRIEYSDLGWYWTDNHVNIPLRPGLQARVPR